MIRQYIRASDFAILSGRCRDTVDLHIKKCGIYLNKGKFRREDLQLLIDSIYNKQT